MTNITYVNKYGTEYAVRKQEKGPALMCRPRDSSKWMLSSTLANLVGDAKTEKELQAVLDKAAADKGWDPIRGFPDWELPMVQEILTWPWMPKTSEEFTAKHFKELDEVRHHRGGSIATGLYDTGPQGIKFSKLLEDGEDGHVDADHTWDDFVRRCIAHGIAPVPNADPISAGPASSAAESAAGSDASPAAESAGLPAGPESDEDEYPPQNPTHAAPASPADAGVAAQNLCAAEPASLEAKDINVPTFDFGADDDTNAALMQDAQIFMAGSMARVMAAKRAHDRTANNYRGSWGKWCDLVGISRDTGDNMVRVAEQFGNIQIDGQNLIDIQPLKLLYAASKPSTPPEIRERVENLDITTYKQYQDLLARYNAEKAAREQAEQDNDFLRADSAKARDAAHTYHRQYDEVAAQRNALIDQQGENIRLRIAAEKERDEALKQRDGARDALQAAKLRGDKLKAENDALKAQPVEAKIIDEEEVDRRAKARAAELTAPLREELEALRNRHPADPEAAEQAIRDAYDSTIYTGRVIENAWHTLRPLLPCMDAERRDLAIRQLSKTIDTIQGEIAACL